MSVIVKRLKSNTMEVYVKGAPEVMADICEKDSCRHFSRTPLVESNGGAWQSRRIMMTCCLITLVPVIALLPSREKVSKACLGSKPRG